MGVGQAAAYSVSGTTIVYYILNLNNFEQNCVFIIIVASKFELSFSSIWFGAKTALAQNQCNTESNTNRNKNNNYP